MRSLSPNNQPPGLQIGCTKNKVESLQITLTVNGIPTQAVVDAGALGPKRLLSLWSCIRVSQRVAQTLSMKLTFSMQE